MSMKLVCFVAIAGVDTLKVLTTVDTMDQGKLVQTKPGIGKPFMMFATLPGAPIMADFEGLPVVSSDVAENNRNIKEMLDNPTEYLGRLTFA